MAVTGNHIFTLTDGVTVIDLRKVISWAPSSKNAANYDLRVMDTDCFLQANITAFDSAKTTSLALANG